ncbi:MAG TPA: DMT family transporter [Gammaproteobacteria bacterium]|jgi:drug/metabolite transporter (DMT)-like permease
MAQLVAGAIAISFSAVFVRLVHVAPTVSAFYRMLFGGGILLAVMLWRREKLAVSAKTFLVLTLAAIFFALDLGLWHRSILYVGPGVATLLANFQVFVLAAVGVLFFKERLTIYQWLAIGLAMIGLILLVGSGWSALSAQYHVGVVLGLITAGCYAGYILTLRSTRTTGEGGSSYAVITVVSLITALILAASVGAEGDSFVIPGWGDAGWLFLYGLVPQVLGWVLISNAMARGVGTAQVGLVLLLQPTFAFIWDWAFFGRHFTGPEMAGATLALVSIYMGSLKGSPFQKRSA